ncbi:D-alanyl-D-alanine carboxypeptidase [Anaerovorax odorimutans]|uniref:D-alanyl-D-alanine carboxypeptidase n=1 Tax=Anaerovorax odorimutans TaxID=109327 RepID=A0ABT1RPM7_9FIRM|nr:D-alanyl-D-alanine carboxypeptidase [Anaerovorax odorimutans]MCQ4636836.1 D-alanyl-D-alanine carboxypeptidase [Anaerovorax odorimutans]
MRQDRSEKKRARRKKLLAVIACLLAVVLVANGWFIVRSLVGSGGAEDAASSRNVEKKPLESIDAEVFSDHMIVMDLTHDKVLFKKAAGEKTRPASLAKMMTALVVIENTEDFNERIKIPHDIYTYLHGSGIAVAGFEDGERLTVEDLLYGMLYKSGAECCLTLARKVSGSEDKFVKLMNEKAKELGMEDTTFGNCIGLDNPACFTTVSDWMKLTKYALKNKHFRSIFASYTYKIEPTNKCDETRTIRNAAVRRFGADRAGVFGGKLGNTTRAELCLASIAKIEGCEYVCISTHAHRTEDRYNPHVDDARTVYKEIEKQMKEQK